MMINGIILAGGKSSRMGQNKILLPYQGKPLLYYALESMSKVCDHIIVVTGKYDQEIRRALEGKNVDVVYNPNYEKGMFSSILAGVSHVDGDFFILPGDCPFVEPATFETLLRGTKDIRVPNYQGNDGHPIFISYKYKSELLSLPLDYNLKLFRDSKDYEIINVEDKNIVVNLNEFLDYLNIQN